jgi:MFS family permease
VESPTTSRLRRRLFFALLYFSEGAPIGYIWWAMPTRLRNAGMPIEQVAALTAMLTLPWALKFLWAPAIDRLRCRRWGYRAWITFAQILMGLTLLPLGLLPLETVESIVTWLLLAHAVSATTQDVAIDALAIATVPAHERARISGWMQAGMLIGRATFGGLALAAEEWIGAGAVVLVLIGCVWVTLTVVWLSPRSEAERRTQRPPPTPLVRTVLAVLSRRTTWAGLGIALTAGAGFEAAGGLMGPFLLDQGAPQSEIGWFLAVPVVAAMIVGALIGGWGADYIGHRRLVAFSVVAIGLCVGLLAAADAWLHVEGRTLMALATPLYLCIGSLTASSYALFMDLTDPEIGGTQFSAYMGATNLCEVWAVAMAGQIAGARGYGLAFVVAGGCSFVALALLPLSRRTTPDLPDQLSEVVNGMDGSQSSH